MANGAGKTLMAAIPADEFVGRDRELDILHTHALSAERPFGMLLSSAPGCGASELLRQTYDRLFFGQAEIIPFYFALRPSDRSAGDAAERFLQQFLLQAAAFRQQDPAVLDSSPDIEELAQIAPQADAFWFDALIETARRDRFSEDGRDRMRSGLSAPLRASARGPRVFAMIDDLHLSLGLNDGDSFVDELGAVFARARVPFVFSARRRFDFRRPELSVVSVGPSDLRRAGNLSTVTAIRSARSSTIRHAILSRRSLAVCRCISGCSSTVHAMRRPNSTATKRSSSFTLARSSSAGLHCTSNR
jgi:hypothetical protein